MGAIRWDFIGFEQAGIEAGLVSQADIAGYIGS